MGSIRGCKNKRKNSSLPSTSLQSIYHVQNQRSFLHDNQFDRAEIFNIVRNIVHPRFKFLNIFSTDAWNENKRANIIPSNIIYTRYCAPTCLSPFPIFILLRSFSCGVPPCSDHPGRMQAGH